MDQNTFRKNVTLFTHLQRPALDGVQFKSIKHNASLVYHQMEEVQRAEIIYIYPSKNKARKSKAEKKKVECFLSVCERWRLFQQLIPPSKYTAHIK